MSTMKTYPRGEIVFETTDIAFQNRQQTITPFNRHSSNTDTFLLDGKYTTFQCSYAIPDNSPASPMTVKFLSETGVLKTVTLSHSEAPVDISVDVTGVDKLEIRMSQFGYIYNATLTPIPQL